jgi:hypothetical protein
MPRFAPPKLKPQDLYTIASLFFGLMGSTSDSMTFIIGWSACAVVFFVIGIRAHDEISRPWKIGATLACIAILVVFDASKAHSLYQAELQSPTGLLIPTGDPQPLSRCGVPEGAIAVYLGSSNTAWVKAFPHAVFQSLGKDLLILDHGPGDSISVSAKIYDDRRNLIATIDKNKYVSTNYAAHFSRPDRSTLIVTDHLGEEALKVVFINQTAIRITGKLFSFDGKQSMVIEDKIMSINGTNSFTGACLGDSTIAF